MSPPPKYNFAFIKVIFVQFIILQEIHALNYFQSNDSIYFPKEDSTLWPKAALQFVNFLYMFSRFGYIAKAIGPHDVLATLLNNLKVQERQNRVCTTVAIAIVAETCSPFTVLPGIIAELQTIDQLVKISGIIYMKVISFHSYYLYFRFNERVQGAGA